MTFTPRLKAGIFVRALVRRAQVGGASATIARKGNEDAGAVIIKIIRPDGTCLVLNQARAGEGELVWVRPLGDWTNEAQTKSWFEKQVKFDPDLWILDIEDREGRAFVDEKIV